jgi:hypothetical protein
MTPNEPERPTQVGSSPPPSTSKQAAQMGFSEKGNQQGNQAGADSLNRIVEHFPRDFIQQGMEIAHGATIYGVPFDELTREEAIALCARGWKEVTRLQGEISRVRSEGMLRDIEIAKRRASAF